MSARNSSQVFALEKSVALSLCESIGSPRALTVWMMVSYGEWDQLIKLTCDPTNYDSAQSFSDDYQVTEILKKNPRLPLSHDKRAIALEKFKEAEVSCAETNDRILGAIKNHQFGDPLISRTLFRAIELIRSILGPLTRADLSYCEDHFGFGPGVTTSLKGRVTYANKYKSRPIDASPRVVDFAVHCRPPGWRALNELTIRSYSKLTTVPKNAKTDRCICVEPDLNIFVQRGIGRLLRYRLSRFGLDLNDSWRRNQDLAREGSIRDDLATVDLSAASDSISREIVWLMLPDRWSDLLYFARTDQYLDPTDGSVKEFHKWSSMGNGYTFELESLIFYSLACAASEVVSMPTTDVLAFGDDIIIPSAALDVLVRTLNFLGFKVNADKTFGKGLFRESCGADFFRGTPVRPLYLRSSSEYLEEVCYIYANSIRATAHRTMCGVGCDVRYLPAWLRCYTTVKPSHRYRIPYGIGDVGFVSNLDEAAPGYRHIRMKHGIYHFRCVGWHSRAFCDDMDGAYSAALNHQLPPFSYGEEIGRNPKRTWLDKRGTSVSWPNLGPWL